MRIQRGLLALFAVALLTVAACSGAPAGPSAATVQTALENATKVKLVDVTSSIGAGAPNGVKVLMNQTTAIADGQFVAVIIADTEANAKTAATGLEPAAQGLGGAAKTYQNKTVAVLYAPLPGGTDNSAAVDAAVKGF